MTTPVPAHMTTAESSQEGPGAPQSSSSEQQRMEQSVPGPSPGAVAPASPAEGLLQQHYREENTLWEQRWDRLGFPQKKKALLGRLRRRHRDHMAPYPSSRDATAPPPGTRVQNRFRCECQYCQGHAPGVSGERHETSNSPSWETLVQGLSGLTLNLGTNQPAPLTQETQQAAQEADKRPPERRQESQRMFHSLLKHWLEDN